MEKELTNKDWAVAQKMGMETKDGENSAKEKLAGFRDWLNTPMIALIHMWNCNRVEHFEWRCFCSSAVSLLVCSLRSYELLDGTTLVTVVPSGFSM